MSCLPALREIFHTPTARHSLFVLKVPLNSITIQVVREAATICPSPLQVDFDLLTLKVVSESRVTWATSVPILILLGPSVLDLGPMYATDRQTDRRQTDDRRASSSLNAPSLGAGHNN